MKDTIKEMIAQAEDEGNFELICWIKEILNEFALTFNCPSNWRDLGTELEREYPKDSWVYENLELNDFID